MISFADDPSLEWDKNTGILVCKEIMHDDYALHFLNRVHWFFYPDSTKIYKRFTMLRFLLSQPIMMEDNPLHMYCAGKTVQKMSAYHLVRVEFWSKDFLPNSNSASWIKDKRAVGVKHLPMYLHCLLFRSHCVTCVFFHLYTFY